MIEHFVKKICIINLSKHNIRGEKANFVLVTNWSQVGHKSVTGWSLTGYRLVTSSEHATHKF